jgi:D-tyrosyl-tRNA(Tyr) deacylase
MPAVFSTASSMIGLLQRVTRASVRVEGEIIASIDQGLLVLVGVQRGDGPAQARRLAERLLAYRVFPDSTGRMNLDVTQVKGGLLLVPQFTLAADTGQGNRPGFSRAAEADIGRALFKDLVTAAGRKSDNVVAGRFGADMSVELINDGPVTFWLEVAPSG